VVVVVRHPELEERDASGGFDPTDQSGLDEGGEDVVHGLGRHGPELAPHVTDDRVGVGMGMAGQDVEHGHARRGDPQPCGADQVDQTLSAFVHHASLHEIL
jgi:hypothetical protein